MNFHRKANCCMSFERSLQTESDIPLPSIFLQNSVRRHTPFNERHLNQGGSFRNCKASIYPMKSDPPTVCGRKANRGVLKKGFAENPPRRTSAPKYQDDSNSNLPEEFCGTDFPGIVLSAIPENSKELARNRRTKQNSKIAQNLSKKEKKPETAIPRMPESRERGMSMLVRNKTVIPQQQQQSIKSVIKIKKLNTASGYPTVVNPTNLEKQEKIFFNSNCTVNPIFDYDNYYLAEKAMETYKVPKTELLPIAIKIMEKLLTDYGSESKYLEETGGPLLNIEETQEIYTNYIVSLGLENNISLAFAENTVSPTTILHDGTKGKSTVVIGLPIEYRKNRIQGVLDHEIGTHFIRKLNDNLQVWSTNRKKYDLRAYMTTEEGFAALNQLVSTVFYIHNFLK